MTTNTTKTPKFDLLFTTLNDASRIMMFTANEARRLPDEMRDAVDRLEVRMVYGSNEHAVSAITALKKYVADNEFIRGVGLRDRKLVELAAKLESLRAVLPELAAKAMMELGRVARDLHNEGSTGEPR